MKTKSKKNRPMAFVLAMILSSFTVGYHATADATLLDKIAACLRNLMSKKDSRAITPIFKFADQVNPSARRLMIAGAAEASNFHSNQVDFIVAKTPGYKGDDIHAYSILIMISANEVITPALKRALNNRFPNWIQPAQYVDRKGTQHQVLTFAPDGGHGGFELPTAELLIILARDSLMKEVQSIRAGIIYQLRYAPPGVKPWFDSETNGFQVPLEGGNYAGNW